jgi:hypothetical protein
MYSFFNALNDPECDKEIGVDITHFAIDNEYELNYHYIINSHNRYTLLARAEQSKKEVINKG